MSKNGLLYALGGVLKGAGDAVAANGKAKREERLELLRRKYQVEDRDYAAKQNRQNTQMLLDGRKDITGMNIDANATQGDKNRGVKVTEGDKDRDLKASEGDANRGLTSSEGDANRSSRKDISDAGNASSLERTTLTLDANSEEKDKDREQTRGLLTTKIEADKENTDTKSKATITAAQIKYGVNNGGMTAGQEREYDAIIASNTTTDENGVDIIDREGAALALKKAGYDNLAESFARNISEPEGRSFPDARVLAIDEASDKAGYLSSDSSDFGEGGREAWITKRSNEIYQGWQGQDNPSNGLLPNSQTPPVAPKNKPSPSFEPTVETPTGTSTKITEGPTYKTKDEVKLAFDNKEISRDEAIRILKDEFGGV